MYVPAHFDHDDLNATFELMQQFPFALLITSLDGEFEGTHIPVLTSRTGDQFSLRFHLARANPSVTALAQERPSLIVFNGPNAYVSPDWYGDHAPNMVPTWNYAVVHARGVAQEVEDAALVEILDDLSAQNEQRLLPKRAWTSDKMDERAFSAMRKAIVGYEVKVSKIQTKFKMGQNRHETQRQGVRTALQSMPDPYAQRVAELIP